MAQWIKMEKFRIVEYRDGCVFKTRREGFEWFEIGKAPDSSIVDDVMWQPTMDYAFQKEKPGE